MVCVKDTVNAGETMTYNDEFFGKWSQWQLWAHYGVLTIIVGLFMDMHSFTWPIESLQNFMIFYAVIAFGDQAIHYAFGKYLDWKD